MDDKTCEHNFVYDEVQFVNTCDKCGLVDNASGPLVDGRVVNDQGFSFFSVFLKQNVLTNVYYYYFLGELQGTYIHSMPESAGGVEMGQFSSASGFAHPSERRHRVKTGVEGAKVC
jgi:hypothetical protein